MSVSTTLTMARSLSREADPVSSGTGRNAPLMERSDFDEPSIFRPENMLRETRRQKGLEPGLVSPVCLLDPDSDIVRHVRRERDAALSREWACYHTEMWEWREGAECYGVVGSAVGASFAVLVAEQLFASGCQLLISVASAGQITDLGQLPYHILIERAVRDEGTSYHYLPPSRYAAPNQALLAVAEEALAATNLPTHRGTTWTTDAPFRETEEALALHQRNGTLAVEMEAAALYAFGAARSKPVLCLAQVTNRLGSVEGDFEKGEQEGAEASLALVRAIAARWRAAGLDGN